MRRTISTVLAAALLLVGCTGDDGEEPEELTEFCNAFRTGGGVGKVGGIGATGEVSDPLIFFIQLEDTAPEAIAVSEAAGEVEQFAVDNCVDVEPDRNSLAANRRPSAVEEGEDGQDMAIGRLARRQPELAEDAADVLGHRPAGDDQLLSVKLATASRYGLTEPSIRPAATGPGRSPTPCAAAWSR